MTQQRSQNDPITKQRVLLFAQQNGDAAAAEKFGIARSTVRGWRRQSKQGLAGYITPDRETWRRCRLGGRLRRR